MRKLLLAVFAMSLCVGAACAADAAPSTISSGEVQRTLDMLKGTSGLEGANASEMNAYMEMLDSEELARVASRLSAQLAEQGIDESSADFGTISDFVRQNLSQKDIESIMGQSISEAEYRQALTTGGKPEDMERLLRVLEGKAK